ncbi:toprim domain-containing protein [Nocardia sp. alder85J]|uniref:toprim domain-containing protein n=1 Tax=Nocardia sp. alder85J TaxID=2862949 RepID=UPI001CD4911B|nr:toprim domain-containing protein [Nocardia sp. alder85J]MCX4099219.1 toprim domain-containing protein [Nocardia sp. alder85J]
MSASTARQGSFETIVAALERTVGQGKPSGAWTKFCCPVHESGGGHHNPSLGVKHIPGEQRTKVRCFAGCDDKDVLAALDLEVRDLYDNPIQRQAGSRERQRAPRVHPRKVSASDRAIDAAGLPLTKPRRDLGAQQSAWKQVAAYPYMTADGEILGEVVRREASFAGGRDKKFHQHRWDSEAGRMVDGGFPAVPFALPAVLDAVAVGEPIYVVEGEKDALTAQRAGLTATTNAGGALSWSDDHARWLDGAVEVVIVADRDAPGYRRAERVMGSLRGRVQSVRVVQAATGKDLTDHVDAGHDIDELDPIPHLDPHTVAAASSPGVVSPAAGPVSEARPPTQPDHVGGPVVPVIMPDPENHPHIHDDTIDHVSGLFGRVVQQLMQQIIGLATAAADRRRREAEIAAADSEKRAAEYQARIDAERRSVETKLAQMQKIGWDRLSRTEIAEALKDSVTWAEDSPVAKRMFAELSGHIHDRYGVHIDTMSLHAVVAAPDSVRDQLAHIDQARAVAARVADARDRMVTLVAGAGGIDESAKPGLYEAIDAWKKNPGGHSLEGLTKKLKSAGVDAKTTAKVRFVAVYLGAPDVEVPLKHLGAVATSNPAAELRRVGEPLVDLGDEAKHRVDTMLLDYQTRLKHGLDTQGVRDRLADAVQVMTPEDQQTARARGVEIRRNPGKAFDPIWPDHVDREALGETIRMYAAMAPQVEAREAVEDGLDPVWAAEQRERVALQRRQIDRALSHGQGLHEYEKDQIRAVLRDVEAGITDAVPEMLFADDRTAAQVDARRGDRIARAATGDHRRDLHNTLHGPGVPAGTAGWVRDEVDAVLAAHTQLAAGQVALPDYEKLLARMAAVGVPEPIRNRVKHQLDDGSRDAATVGKQAHRIQDVWAERRELVAAARSGGDPVAYDGPARRQATADHLAGVGLSPQQVAGRMAVDAGHAHPAQAAVQSTPRPQLQPRTTRSGTGIGRATGRRRPGPEKGRGI